MNKFKFLFDTLYRDPISINLNLHLVIKILELFSHDYFYLTAIV